MARIRIEDIVDHLDREFKEVLEDTIRKHFPSVSFNNDQLFRDFVRAIHGRCNRWENVPDQYVER